MIAWWGWIFIIAGGLSLFVLIISVIPWLIVWGIKGIEQFGYSHEAKKRNKMALRLRLSRTDWEGIPLPSGKSGMLRISEKTLIANRAFSMHQLESVMRNRGLDLNAVMDVSRDDITRDIIVRWHPDPIRKTIPHYKR